MSMNNLGTGRLLVRVSNNYPKQRQNTNDDYVQIGDLRYIIGGTSSLLNYEFKINRRGGDISKVEFGFNETTVKSNDNIVLAFKGKPVYVGYVSKLEKNNTIITCSPLWAKLMSTFFTVPYDDVTNKAFEPTEYGFYELMEYIKPFIESQGITVNYNTKYIDVPRNQKCTLTLAGYTIDQILNEMEKFIPKRYVWGVGVDKVFYYKDFDKAPNRTINYLNDAFSDTKLGIDYSDIYSEYTVLLKEYVDVLDINEDGEEVVSKVERQRPIGVVGTLIPQKIPYVDIDHKTKFKEKLYPPLNFTDLVGSKNNKFQVPYTMDNEVALDLAYNELRKQQPVETCDIENINIDKWSPQILESANIYCFPNQGNVGVVSFEVQDNPQIVLDDEYGNLISLGDYVGRSFGLSTDPKVLNLEYNDSWQFTCDRTERLDFIRFNYKSKNIITKFRIFDNYGNFQETEATGGIVTFITDGYDKRTIKIVMIDPHAGDPKRSDNEFTYTRVIGQFSRGSEFFTGVVREIEYKFDNGIIKNKIKMSKIGSVITGYLKRMTDRLESIDKILQG